MKGNCQTEIVKYSTLQRPTVSGKSWNLRCVEVKRSQILRICGAKRGKIDLCACKAVAIRFQIQCRRIGYLSLFLQPKCTVFRLSFSTKGVTKILTLILFYFFTILKRYLHFGTFYYKTLWFKLKGEYSYQVIDVVYELSTLLRFNNQCFSRYLKPLLS